MVVKECLLLLYGTSTLTLDDREHSAYMFDQKLFVELGNTGMYYPDIWLLIHHCCDSGECEGLHVKTNNVGF